MADRIRTPLQKLQNDLVDSIVDLEPLEDIRDMLACGASVNEPLIEGLRPLHYAVYQGYTDAIKLLLERGSDPNLMDDGGYTALHFGAQKGYTDIVKLLMNYGARVCFTDLQEGDEPEGDPPRASAADEPLRLAIKRGHYLCAELLLKSGADPNARYYMGSEINLINSTNLPSLELLLKYGAYPDALDRNGMSPLMKACRDPEGLDAAYLLLSYGADVNLISRSDNDCRTALHYAVISGNVNIVSMLLEHGALVEFPYPYRRSTALNFAVLTGNVEILKLLIKAGGNVNSGSEITGSSLHIALSEKVKNKTEIIRILLENGADPNSVSVSSDSPLLRPPLGEYIQSTEQPKIELVRLLLRHGARVIMKHQIHHPLGILKTVHRLHLGLTPEVLTLLVDATEEYNIASIEGSNELSDDHKEILLSDALSPPSMKRIARFAVRHYIARGKNLPEKIYTLPVPHVLKLYLLFDANA